MKTPSFRDVEVMFRGRRAWVQARRVAGDGADRVQLASIRIEGDVDRRGQEVQHTLHDADPEGEASRVEAFSALTEEEQRDLKRQVREAFRG